MADNNAQVRPTNAQVRPTNAQIQLRKMEWIDYTVALNLSCMFATLILFALYTQPLKLASSHSICNFDPKQVNLRFYLMLSSSLFLFASMTAQSLKLYINFGRVLTSPQVDEQYLYVPLIASAAATLTGFGLMIVAIVNLVIATLGEFSCGNGYTQIIFIFGGIMVFLSLGAYLGVGIFVVLKTWEKEEEERTTT
ncbi:hypothetical protein PIB30_069849 [Stylosanthes scabra]|uniref:Uncharacterized protein n=1 Tax=Stylosanthes scabra TaxID=79078 RepID=A0ABU6SNQ2_9FABA|nr:hypothetical protein [Stylosanthes scabra]